MGQVDTVLVPGSNPLEFESLNILILQIVFIFVATRVVGFILRKLGQPRNIAPVISGILLGRSAFGQFNGYMENVFPESSIGTLDQFAQFGLVLFLFLVGLEIDMEHHKISKQASIISMAGIVFPFLASFISSKTVYDQVLQPTSVSYSSFALFFGIASSITAYPVLARILSETKCLNTSFGKTALDAAAFDDVIVWCFIAVDVSLFSNSGRYQVAAYSLLVLIGWALALIFLIRHVFFTKT